MSIKRSREPRQITGPMVLAGMIAFFAVVFAVNGVFAWLALSSFPGVDTPDAYRKGVNYSETLAADRAQRALGWLTSVEWRDGGTARGTLVLRISDADGAAVSGVSAGVTLRRPVTEKADRRATLAETAPGTYEAAVVLPGAGNWDAVIEIARDGAALYRLRERIVVP